MILAVFGIYETQPKGTELGRFPSAQQFSCHPPCPSVVQKAMRTDVSCRVALTNFIL